MLMNDADADADADADTDTDADDVRCPILLIKYIYESQREK